MSREEEFGAKLKELRQAKGWSVRKAAQAVGISHYRLDELEIGRSRSTGNPTRPSREVVALLARAYEVPTDFLLQLAGYAKEHPELPDEEALLLDLYRSLDSDERELLIRLGRAIRKD